MSPNFSSKLLSFRAGLCFTQLSHVAAWGSDENACFCLACSTEKESQRQSLVYEYPQERRGSDWGRTPRCKHRSVGSGLPQAPCRLPPQHQQEGPPPVLWVCRFSFQPGTSNTTRSTPLGALAPSTGGLAGARAPWPVHAATTARPVLAAFSSAAGRPPVPGGPILS